MGSFWTARCKKCGTEFEVAAGLGMAAVVLRCQICGDGHSLKLTAEILDARSWDAVGLVDWDPGEHTPGLVPACQRGGTFSVHAKPRCPNCRSTKLERVEGEGAWGSWD